MKHQPNIHPMDTDCRPSPRWIVLFLGLAPLGLPGQEAEVEVQEPPADPGMRIVTSEGEDEVAGLMPYTYNFLNAPLEPVFEVFTELTGKMVLYSPDLTGNINLMSGSVELDRSEAIEAITSSLSLAGIVMMPMGEKFVKAVKREEAIQHATRLNSVDPDLLPESGEFLTRTVQLEQILPSEAVEILRPLTSNPDGLIPVDSSRTLLIHSDASSMKQMLALLKQTDVVPEFEYSLEVIPIKYSKVHDLYNTMNSLITGEPELPTDGSSPSATGQLGRGGQNTFGGAYGGFNQRGVGSGYGGYGSGGYGGSYGGRSVGGYRPYQAARTQTSGGSNSTTFQDNLRRVISRAASDEEEVELLSKAKIVPDQRSNSLLIFADRQDISMITNMVSKVDQLLAQVLIEAIVLEINIGDELNFGVSMQQGPDAGGNWNYGGTISNPVLNSLSDPLRASGDFLGGTEAPAEALSAAGGFSYFARYNDTLQAAVSAIASDTSTRIISRPRIQTSHAVQGYFQLGESIPYSAGGFSGGLSAYSQQYVEFLEIGITISVTPYITPEGYIVMDIVQNANSRGEDVIINNNPTPVANTRIASATLSVRDGDTIMLGGFIRQSKNKSRAGVPILKDIPLLGSLFRSRNDRSQRSELIILLRATVLETPEEAAMVARMERENTAGIREMEKSFEAEREQREEASKEGERRGLFNRRR